MTNTPENTKANCETSRVMGQAYQVIGILAENANLFDHPEVVRALDYFASNEYQEDFLPLSFEKN